MNKLKKTPLYEEHSRINPEFGSFAGWILPLFYEGIIPEHNHCRTNCSIFDTCHMGILNFKGDIAASGIETAFTRSISRIPNGHGKYGFILNENAGIIDDLILFRISDDELMIVVNASTVNKDFKAISERIKSGELTDVSKNTAKIDIQGPLCLDVLRDTLNLPVEQKLFEIRKYALLDKKILLSRTGYTGELGYELFLPPDIAPRIWRTLINDPRVKPAGLGARDILRLEMGYSLYGSDISEDTTPLQADLAFFIDMDKNFVGKDALLEEKKRGHEKCKIAFATESRRAPRQGYSILLDNIEIGKVSSGTFAPSLNCGIGLGYIDSKSKVSDATFMITKGKSINIAAKLVKLPFYKKGTLRYPHTNTLH
ncbi:glycine cleavage system aminomethyltransferase GcvT [Elusimicrobiota bacterium]